MVQITGKVTARPAGMENSKLSTGEIEVTASGLNILNKADVPPFPLDDPKVNEDLRMEYRYLDLRTARMQENLKLRHRITKAARDYFDEQGFLEIETPVLSNPTPEEGDKPSRLTPGFRSAPRRRRCSNTSNWQQVAGLEKYFRSAKRCFRDEDWRADRQPEFTQIDVEASFITDEDIQTLTEGLLARKITGEGNDIPVPFPRISYQDAMNRYGSDKPDTRFGAELVDLGGVFSASQFKVFRSVVDGGGVIKALNAKGVMERCYKEQLKKWEEWVKTECGAKGLAYKWSKVK